MVEVVLTAVIHSAVISEHVPRAAAVILGRRPNPAVKYNSANLLQSRIDNLPLRDNPFQLFFGRQKSFSGFYAVLTVLSAQFRCRKYYTVLVTICNQFGCIAFAVIWVTNIVSHF